MKRILCGLIAIIIMAIPLSAATTTSEDYIPSDGILLDRLNEYQERKENAHAMAQAARNLGFGEDSDIIKTAKEEWVKANQQYLYYQSFYQKYQEYPVATNCWIYLTEELGYNPYISAGIIGNMMVECGDTTLNLIYNRYGTYNTNFYGLCMWCLTFNNSINGMSLMEQLDYLAGNIKEEFDTFGYMYYSGFNYSQFLTIENTGTAALAFNLVYERCGCGMCEYLRASCAEVAYNYFMS